MKKFNTLWIVLIVICSVICLGGLIYFIYRLYIRYIYKRKPIWNDISSPMKRQSEQTIEKNIEPIMPRQSVLPLIQQYLSNEYKKPIEQRKMVTHLQFNEPPLFIQTLKEEWDEMDTKSLFSTRSSYYTIRKQQSKSDNDSTLKYFSIKSSDEMITPPSSTSFLSKNQNSSSNSLVLNLENLQRINYSNSFSNI